MTIYLSSFLFIGNVGYENRRENLSLSGKPSPNERKKSQLRSKKERQRQQTVNELEKHLRSKLLSTVMTGREEEFSILSLLTHCLVRLGLTWSRQTNRYELHKSGLNCESDKEWWWFNLPIGLLGTYSYNGIWTSLIYSVMVVWF